MTDEKGEASNSVDTDALPPARNSSVADPWPIARLNQSLKDYVARLNTVWVEGEIAQINSKGASLFLDLKDLAQEARINCHSWQPAALPNDLVVGDRVVAQLQPEFWPKGGKLSMRLIAIRKVGLGDLLERLERLRQVLIAEGLTALERKQKLPFLPNCIGLITGEKSDAEKDVLENTKRRWPDAQFRVVNTKVQGDSAAPEIIRAIKQLDEDPEVDVIIIARGGGAAMELLVFSDEALVRAAAMAKTPIISAIGHENDSPLLDLVADVRASTPTDAARKVVPDVAEERERIATVMQRMKLRIASYIESQSELLQLRRQHPMLANPFGFIELEQEQLTVLLSDLRDTIELTLERGETDLKNKRQVLRSLSPQSTLDRGYAVVRDTAGHVLADAAKVKPGTQILVRLAKGDLTAETK